MSYTIRDWQGHYLVAGTQSRGCQGGVGRLWSADYADALKFPTAQSAQDVLDYEFDEFDVKFSKVAVDNSATVL